MSDLTSWLVQHDQQDNLKLAAWNHAILVYGTDANRVRKDSCGAWIQWSDYGNTNSQYGWEVDHITPTSHGGANTTNNVQALQWQNNRAKSNNISINYCTVSAA